jgi:hypothetical protein
MDILGEQYAAGLQEMVLRIRMKVAAEQGDDADFGIVWYAERPIKSERHCLLTRDVQQATGKFPPPRLVPDDDALADRLLPPVCSSAWTYSYGSVESAGLEWDGEASAYDVGQRGESGRGGIRG